MKIMHIELQIQNDVEQLRTRVSETPGLYREICALQFFRYGITPTANMLYQYVKKGSMSAPAAALKKFWSELREKSRVRIEHPDLPLAVKDAAGHLVSLLRSEAQTVALHTHEASSNEWKEKISQLESESSHADQLLTATRN